MRHRCSGRGGKMRQQGTALARYTQRQSDRPRAIAASVLGLSLGPSVVAHRLSTPPPLSHALSQRPLRGLRTTTTCAAALHPWIQPRHHGTRCSLARCAHQLHPMIRHVVASRATICALHACVSRERATEGDVQGFEGRGEWLHAEVRERQGNDDRRRRNLFVCDFMR